MSDLLKFLFLFFVYLMTVCPVKSYAQSAQEYFQAAELYRKNGDYEAALKHYQSALEMRFNWGEAHAGRGYTFARLKQYDKALLSYVQALEFEPFENDYLMRYNKGWAHYNSGDKTSACQEWQKAYERGYALAAEAIEKHCSF